MNPPVHALLIQLHFGDWAAGVGHSHGYRLAGASLFADVPFCEYTCCFAAPLPASLGTSDSSLPPAEPVAECRVVSGWIADRDRKVTCSSHPSGFSLEIEDIGQFWIARAGSAIRLTAAEQGVAAFDLEQCVLGPALALALATRGVFLLHASAVARDGRLNVFLGLSGAGKSTLARLLAAWSVDGWDLVADDILPVTLDDGRLVALPHYPQYKLSPERQPHGLPERMPVVTCYEIDPTPTDEITLVTLPPRNALLRLIRHTVASRLFDSALLKKHLHFCAEAIQSVLVRQLSYPRRFDIVESLERRILF